MNSQKDMTVIVGNFFIDSLNKYLKNLPQEEFETLDKTTQNVYYARIEASRIKEQYGCEPPLGFVRTTKAYTIPANSHIGIHGLTKVKHGGWSVNVVNENPQISPLPHGLKTESTLSQLSPGSNRILVAMSNYSDQDITIPAKTIISQSSLGNKVPKMIYPGDDKDSELLDKDEGLKYEHFEQHKLISEELKLEPEEYIPTSCDKTCDQSHTVEVEDLGLDLEEDIEFQNSYTDNDKPNLGKSDQPTSSEKDDGSWILKLIDLSGLEKWSEDDKNAAIEMIKRNANIFSKNVLTTAKLDACGQRWVAKLANYNFTIQYRSGQSNVEADALSRISWPKVLDGTNTVDVENMDTHIVNAIITGAQSKSSLIESISSSPEIVPKELISDSNEPPLDWFKLQRADPSLATIIHLMESDQLYKRKPYKKDSADVKSLLRIKKSLVLTKGILFRKSFTDNTSSKKII